MCVIGYLYAVIEGSGSGLVTGLILLTINSKFQIIVKILIIQNPQTKIREILADLLHLCRILLLLVDLS